MATTKIIVEHIRTSAGARFATYTSDEDRRVQLIQYYNEVHAGPGVDEFADDADLSEVVDAIEDIEDVSSEEIWLNLPDPIEIVASVFKDAKGAPTSFEDQEWIEGFQDGRAIIAYRLALDLKDTPGFDPDAFIKACDIMGDEPRLDWDEPVRWSSGEEISFAPYDSPADGHRQVSACAEWTRVTGDNFVAVNLDGSIMGCEEDDYPTVVNETDEELLDKAEQKHNAQMLDGCETEDELNAELRHQTQGR